MNGRKRITARPVGAALSGLALAAVVGIIPATSAQAQPNKPSIDNVQARVDTLYHQAEQASERYNDAKLQLQDIRKDLASLKSDQKRQDDRLSAVQQQVQDSVVRQYEGQSIGAVGQVVVSKDPSQFLAQLSTMSAFNDLQGQLFEDYSTQVRALQIRSSATQKRAAQLADVEHQLAQEKSTVDEKLAEARSLLGKLKAQQRERMVSRSSTVRTPVATTSVPASGRAGAAVSFAMAQVGEAYVYGAAGPSAWDCSGLTMVAWAQAGVSLPHSSSAQYSSGPHVSESELQPGDLVFYYQPISHVGMYIGNGMIVNAENPSVGVKVTSLHSMPYVGAVRPG
nr:NlpC/P60 family protein [Nocardioides panaciterrulae]